MIGRNWVCAGYRKTFELYPTFLYVNIVLVELLFLTFFLHTQKP